MSRYNKFALVLTTLLLGLVAMSSANAAESISLDDLLSKVKSGRVSDSKENVARIAAFKADKARQQQLLAGAKQQRAAGEARSQALETAFEENDLKIIDLEIALKERLGSLKELFGVLQQASGDARGQFESSLTQAQFPDRTSFLTELAQKMGQTSRLASLEEIERLWFELQREMTESGKVSSFPATVVSANGDEEQRTVTRVGAFNVISEGKYLQFVPETGRLLELGRQPQDRYLDKVAAFENASGGIAPLGVDPSRGQILSLLVQAPDLRERIDQGGVVGYVIIGLGALALLIAIERLLTLTFTGLRISSQSKKTDQPGNNP